MLAQPVPLKRQQPPTYRVPESQDPQSLDHHIFFKNMGACSATLPPRTCEAADRPANRGHSHGYPSLAGLTRVGLPPAHLVNCSRGDGSRNFRIRTGILLAFCGTSHNLRGIGASEFHTLNILTGNNVRERGITRFVYGTHRLIWCFHGLQIRSGGVVRSSNQGLLTRVRSLSLTPRRGRG